MYLFSFSCALRAVYLCIVHHYFLGQLTSEWFGCLYFALQAGAHKDESNIPEMQNTTMI